MKWFPFEQTLRLNYFSRNFAFECGDEFRTKGRRTDPERF